MTPNRAEARAADPGLAKKIAALTKAQDHGQVTPPRHGIEVYGRLWLSPPGAAYDRLTVDTCPWCPFPMHHVVPVGATGPIVRSPRCAPWRSYVVTVVGVVPASASAGTREKGAA